MKHALPNRRQPVRGALLTMLVGDALGVSCEFHDAADIPALADIEMMSPSGFARAHQTVAPGTWAVARAQARCFATRCQPGRRHGQRQRFAYAGPTTSAVAPG